MGPNDIKDELDTVLGEDDGTDDEALVGTMDRILETHVGDTPMGPFVPQPLDLTPMRSEPFNAETALCLRGPCRYYFRRRMPADVGNTEGTFAKPLMQTEHFCSALSPQVFDLTGDPPVKECSHWWPVDVELEALKEKARERVRQEHPEWFVAKPEVQS